MSARYQFVADHASQYPVTVRCQVLAVARSGFYAWKRRPASTHAQRDAALTHQIQAVFRTSRHTYGSPRVHAALRDAGVLVARKRVARLMRHARLVARSRRQRGVRTTNSRHAQPIAPNVLDRQFTVAAPNRAWVADITYLPTREGWLYLAVVLDLFARRVVGWALRPMLERELVAAALHDAIRRRQPAPGLVHHSDRGSQYASAEYQALLAQTKMMGSMRRTGNCWDNAVMESFFATRKAELPTTVFETHETARTAVFDYIERFYNRQRRHSTLNYATPLTAEQAWAAQPTVG